MAGAGRIQVALATEAMRQKNRQQEYDLEQEKLFTTLLFPEKLKALAEAEPKKKAASPKSPLAFVNRAFNSAAPMFFPNAARRASVDAVPPVKPKPLRSPHRRNASLDALDSCVELLEPEPELEPACADIEACPLAPKERPKRIYVSRPLVPRRFSADERPCVTIFSSEAPLKPKLVTPPPRPCAPLAPRLVENPGVKLRQHSTGDVVDGRKRILSFPNLDAYEALEDDLKYWRDVLRNSPQLRALEKH